MTALANYGWTPDFARDFLSFDVTGAIAGRIRTQNRLYYFAFTEQGDLPVQLAGRLRLSGDAASLPVVGDWVALRPPATPDGMAMIEAVLPRRTAYSRAVNDLSRTDAPAGQQIIAANIDLVLIVTGADADLNARRLERFLAAALTSGAVPAIVLTKTDLVDDVPALVTKLTAELPDVPIYPISNRTGEGLPALRAAITPGRTAVLVGSSGVGKSTLVNHFRESTAQATAATDAQGRGRHTTTSRDLFLLEGGGLLMDTPGIRVITPWDAEGLDPAFADIEALAVSCRFSNCQHNAEPGCAVVAAMEAGALLPDRLAAYRKLGRELAHLDRKGDKRAEAEQRRKWRALTKESRRQEKKL
jgi:ribosome biogenesis GTPase